MHHSDKEKGDAVLRRCFHRIKAIQIKKRAKAAEDRK